MPTFKKGNKLDEAITDQYHSYKIYISKIIEKLIPKRLNSFLEQSNIFYQFQFGFRDYHLTTRALIEMADQTEEACDCGLYACGIYLDLKKAFDTVKILHIRFSFQN